MKFLVGLALVAASCGATVAQDFDRYKTILPQGLIPKDFTEQTSVKVSSEITNLSDKKAKVKRTKKKFVLESTFSIDDFLASGNVLFNDDVSLYLDEVLKEILKPYPDLQNKVRIYAVKSPSVNAFTTNNGMIFVNLGLLSRLENEAQLAFVLSHEVIHYQKQHVINAYVTNIEIDKSRDYRKLSMGEKEFAKSSYSKDLESEADMEGSDIYLKSQYARDSVDRVFDILKMADFPQMWVRFDKTLFESGAYVFTDTISARAFKPIKINEDYDDSGNSHPNIRKRREAVLEKFNSGTGGTDFRISKDRFYRTKKIAAFETCRLYLLEHRHEEALALALSLQSENPRSTYIQETIAKACYGIASKSLNDKLRMSDEKWMGASSRLASFLKNRSSYELSVLAIRQLYTRLEANTSNRELQLMVEDMIRQFAKDQTNLSKKFLREASQKPIEGLTHPYTQYAFLSFKDVPAFFKLFDKQVSEASKAPQAVSKRKKKSTKSKSKPKPLKIDKIVVVNPMYRKIDLRKKQKNRHVEAERVLININDKINNAASELGMKAEIINPNKISKHQVAAMQSNTILNDWIDEKLHFSGDDERLVSPIYNEVVELANNYKTDHFVWMGGIAVREKKRGKGTAVLGAVIMPALIPFSAAHLVAPKGMTLYFALVFNVRTQQMEWVDVRAMTMNDSESLLQSNIYYTLFKLKK